MAQDDSAANPAVRGDTSESEVSGSVDDVGTGMSEQRKQLLRAWGPIVNRLRMASLPITFAFDEPGGYWAFVVRRLDAVGLVVAEEHDNSITLRAITIPRHTTPHANSEPTYGSSGAQPPIDANDDSVH